MRSFSRCCLLILFLVCNLSTVGAYNLFGPYPWGTEGDTYYSKWGDYFHAGTPAGTITWSLMPNGTTLDPLAPSYMHGTSNLTSVFNQVGGQTAALAMIQSALDHWSALANIQYVYVGVDDGTPFGAAYAPGQVLGDIRIGAFEIDGYSAAVGYAPPPNGFTTLEGDLIFNSRPDISYYVAPETEGQLYDLYPPGGGYYRNDFEGLVAHELGHASGLAHSDVPSDLMCGYVDGTFDGGQCAYYDPDADGKAPVNRIPDPDDAAGMEFLYGPAPSADFDHDNDVDGRDFLEWQRGNSPHPHGAGDLALWQNQYGMATLLASTAIPEPSCGVLFLCGIAVQVGRNRRR